MRQFVASTTTGNAVQQDEIQQSVIAFLSQPAAHGGEPVRRIDTHGAAVFLCPSRVLKIKRAVKFSFLDYSTVERRRQACEQELTVNRRFAPQVYRRTVPIRRAPDGSLHVGGDSGEIVEWAIEMTPFDDRQTLDHLAAAGPLEPKLVAAIADVIADSHSSAPQAAAAPWIASIPGIIAGNTAAFRDSGQFGADDIEALDRRSRAALAQVAPLLERRGDEGFVRHCHGDLHLSNIVMIDGAPVLFDAIEFDPQIASTDVLYDLAFPLMDFIHYGRRDAASVLLNRYLAITSEANLDALAAFPLLLSLRAAIRANVTLSRPAADAAAREKILRSASAYFILAGRLIAPPPPRLVAVGGLSGTGKSVLAQTLATFIDPLPGSVVLRSDIARKRLFGVRETDRLPTDAYRADVTETIYRGLAERAAAILAQGHSVIVDAVFARAGERSAIAEVARQRGVRFDGLHLVADLQTRLDRVSHRVADASDATAAIVRQQENYDAGSIDWATIDAAGTPAQTLTRAQAATGVADQACST